MQSLSPGGKNAGFTLTEEMHEDIQYEHYDEKDLV